MSFLFNSQVENNRLGLLDAMEFLGSLLAETVDWFLNPSGGNNPLFEKTKITIEGEVFHLPSAEISSDESLEFKSEIHLRILEKDKTFFTNSTFQGQAKKQFPMKIEISISQNYEALTNYQLLSMAESLNLALSCNHFIYTNTVNEKNLSVYLNNPKWQETVFDLDNNNIKLLYLITINHI